MVLDGLYPSDIRVRKEAEFLSKSHEVFVLCNRSEGEEKFEIVNGVKIFRTIKRHKTTLRGIVDIIASINFIHPLFKRELSKFIDENKIQALHVHDLPLAKTVLLASKKHKIISVLDLHENYPAALSTWFSWRKSSLIRLKNNIFFNYNRWFKYEAKMIVKFDFLITVVNEMKERIISQHKVSPDKIIVVPNSEKKEFASSFQNNEQPYFNNQKDKFIISYVGGFGPHRGLHTAIEGMKFVKEEIPNALLVLVGPSNRDVKLHLESIIEENDLENFVELRDRVSFNSVVNIMKGSHINVIPHISNEHTESAVPHKFYQILLSGSPLLVSDCAPMKRLVVEKEIGYYFKAEDPKSFAMEVVKINKDYNQATKKSAKGYDEAFNGSLNWEHTSKELLKLYDDLKV